MNHSDQNEFDLLYLLKNGDEEAFSTLYDQYSKTLWRFLEKYNISSLDIEDSIQTTFIKVWENRNTIDPDKSFKNYLITVAKNDIYNRVKRNIIEQKYLSYIVPKVDSIDNTKELNIILLRILDNLPEKRAQVYRMSRLEGYKNEEIARELGISKSTVENHINNSNSIIKKILKNLGFVLVLFF
ncbi:sigma-70 family RNA polymerase sigma factor [Sphingobacterium bovistauri]|uniref:Sigma-70 family RNA polymerase sigma factor n=1 Tax=Sphingobacterium bovistauri TaxID=2781959 RepID=A0ABS7Z8U4_9SPHI|nr:sigma-70 family RNA polymerase sigma factor [Sphingobacterium bovistauri]MCA5006575.1 sigma-70 family RNA polymerase sigma factor [Sphingobacterium bovistauri]